MGIGKAHFIREAEAARRKAREAKAEAKTARRQYEETAAGLQPRIDELSREADELAAKFKRLYEESQEHYDAREGGAAKELAEEGHEAEDRCRRLNAEANALRRELKGLYDRYENLNREAARFEEDAETAEEQGWLVRETDVTGFGGSVAKSNFAVEEFLDTFPQGLFHKIERIEYRAAHEEYENEGAEGVTSRPNEFSRKRKIRIFPHDDEAHFKKTISHEIGHVAFYEFLTWEEKDRWAALAKKLALAGKRISGYAWNSNEHFCECFSTFKVEPQVLKKFDEEVYTFMEDTFKSLPK
ncbi:MAG: putative nuclear RNA export factor SDE5 [Patescibacteria group bacterium]|nr:putative nuclear RNA export factor SDE5 [Patescibacteria group bacterium]